VSREQEGRGRARANARKHTCAAGTEPRERTRPRDRGAKILNDPAMLRAAAAVGATDKTITVTKTMHLTNF
jgi:hypothetical protein